MTKTAGAERVGAFSLGTHSGAQLCPSLREFGRRRAVHRSRRPGNVVAIRLTPYPARPFKLATPATASSCRDILRAASRDRTLGSATRLAFPPLIRPAGNN